MNGIIRSARAFFSQEMNEFGNWRKFIRTKRLRLIFSDSFSARTPEGRFTASA